MCIYVYLQVIAVAGVQILLEPAEWSIQLQQAGLEGRKLAQVGCLSYVFGRAAPEGVLMAIRLPGFWSTTKMMITLLTVSSAMSARKTIKLHESECPQLTSFLFYAGWEAC